MVPACPRGDNDCGDSKCDYYCDDDEDDDDDDVDDDDNYDDDDDLYIIGAVCLSVCGSQK